jgi:hypothetical protein
LLSLLIFSLAFLINSTLLNPEFITSEIDRFQVSSLTETIINEQASTKEFPEELREASINTVTKLEPVVKEQLKTAIHSTYEYLLGKRENPELAQTLRNTIFNSDFVITLFEELNLPLLAEEIISEQMPPEKYPSEFIDALIYTIIKLEPQLKVQAGDAADYIFAYLIGERNNLDLVQILRSTLLSSDFISSLIDDLEISTLAGEFISEQIIEEFSAEIPMEQEFILAALNDTFIKLEPWLKKQLATATNPILDYLLSESSGFSIIVPLAPIIETLGETAKENFLESTPPEFEGIPQSELEDSFIGLFEGLSTMLPATFEINESILGNEIQADFASVLAEGEASLARVKQDIALSITETEQGLEDARLYISYFQLGYTICIVFILLLILGIVLIYRQVKRSALNLGVIFLVLGAIELIVIFTAKYFIGAELHNLTTIPMQIQAWLPRLLNNFFAPLQWLSIGLVAAGIALIVVSFVYKPNRLKDEV